MVKLYPSVPKKECFQACEAALSTRLKSLVCKAALLEMIQTVLDNNVFGFGDQTHIQKEGIAIGLRLGKKLCLYLYAQMERSIVALQDIPIFPQEIYR